MPIMMPSTVRADRSRWDDDGLEAGAEGLEDSSSDHRPLAAVRRVDDLAVPDADGPPGDLGHVGLVGDEHDGAAAPVQLVEQAAARPSADTESRLPVGSSARIRSGSVTSARATATRCCWPPESSPGRWSTRSARPTRSSASSARCVRSDRSTPA